MSNYMCLLEWSVRALAKPAEIQLRLFPEFVCVADELALDFDEHYEGVTISSQLGSLNPAQRTALKRLDVQLSLMSGPENKILWTDEALRSALEWELVRSIAAEVLDLMRWPSEPPPAGRAIYVGPDEYTGE